MYSSFPNSYDERKRVQSDRWMPPQNERFGSSLEAAIRRRPEWEPSETIERKIPRVEFSASDQASPFLSPLPSTFVKDRDDRRPPGRDGRCSPTAVPAYSWRSSNLPSFSKEPVASSSAWVRPSLSVSAKPNPVAGVSTGSVIEPISAKIGREEGNATYAPVPPVYPVRDVGLVPKPASTREEDGRLGRMERELQRVKQDQETYGLLRNVVATETVRPGMSSRKESPQTVKNPSPIQLTRSLIDRREAATRPAANSDSSESVGSTTIGLSKTKTSDVSRSSVLRTGELGRKAALPLSFSAAEKSTTPRWESWRNLGSQKADVSSAPAPRPSASDSWRNVSDTPSESTSWRNPVQAAHGNYLTAPASVPRPVPARDWSAERYGGATDRPFVRAPPTRGMYQRNNEHGRFRGSSRR
ncbi:hypothetical protein Q1695_014704 [Nippostrongylus brasiliensis]|nr:hypothetical protein Q1695_014704 [Nippostrongylus brasiliensis]